MNRTFIICLFSGLMALLWMPQTVSAQGCTPDSQYTTQGFYPLNLPAGETNVPYDTVMTLVVPADTFLFGFTIPVDSLVINEITDLPPGITYECNAGGPNCVFAGGESGCIRFSGTPTACGDTFRLDVDLTIYVTVFGTPSPFDITLVDTIFFPITSFDATTSTTPANCAAADGSATVTPIGDTGPFTYLWDGGSTDSILADIPAGKYSVMVTDSNSCTESFSVEVPNVIGGAEIDSATSMVSWSGCAETPGGMIAPAVSGGTAPLSYSWSNGGNTQDIMGLAEGTYTLTVTDDDECQSEQLFSITAPAIMELILTGTDENIAGRNDGTATVAASGGVGPYTYSWSTGATTTAISDLEPGTYIVTVTDANGCVKIDSVAVGARPLSTELARDIASLRVFPNPTDQQVTVAFDLKQAGLVEVSLLDLQGRVLAQRTGGLVSSWQTDFTLPGAGVYLIVLETAAGRTVRQVLSF